MGSAALDNLDNVFCSSIFISSMTFMHQDLFCNALCRDIHACMHLLDPCLECWQLVGCCGLSSRLCFPQQVLFTGAINVLIANCCHQVTLLMKKICQNIDVCISELEQFCDATCFFLLLKKTDLNKSFPMMCQPQNFKKLKLSRTGTVSNMPKPGKPICCGPTTLRLPWVATSYYPISDTLAPVSGTCSRYVVLLQYSTVLLLVYYYGRTCAVCREPQNVLCALYWYL